MTGPEIWDCFIEATGEEDSSDWKGHTVELFRTWTRFQGRDTPAIRVRKPNAPTKKPKKAPKEDNPPEFNDEIGF